MSKPSLRLIHLLALTSFSLASFGALSSTAAVARADEYYAGPPVSSAGGISDWTVQHRSSDLSVLAWLPWYYGFGVGAELRYEIFIVPHGFIPTINNSFSLEPSIGLAYTTYGVPGYNWSITDIAPALYGLWSFYFSPAFRLYGGLGLGYNIGIATAPYGYNGTIGDSYFYWDPVVGISFKLAQNFALRGELGTQGVKAGISFYF
jgi:hypothetical protein